MSRKRTRDPLALPSNVPHFFSCVVFDYVPEIDYAELEELSQLARASNKTAIYWGLRQALIKLQWAKLSMTSACAIEATVLSAYRSGVLQIDFAAQVAHSMSLLNFTSHCKAALDALAVFFNEVLELGLNGGARDFRRASFQRAVSARAIKLAPLLEELSGWLDKDNDSSRGLVATRDQWIHLGGPNVPQFWPPTALGAFPVPFSLNDHFESHEGADLEQRFWSTTDFTAHHYRLLVRLFAGSVKDAIAREREALPTFQVSFSSRPVSFLPVLATSSEEIHAIELGPLSRVTVAQPEE